LAVCLLAWLAFISIPLLQGEIGLSWDALNHHVYLGWTAEHPRMDRDYVASGYQAYQFPYLYWPMYKLAVGGWSGAAAGVVLATIHLLAVPPVWMLARSCMPGRTLFDVLMRGLAVALAFLTSVVLSLFDSTANDLMAAIPLAWSVAYAIKPLAEIDAGSAAARRCVLLSGIFAGLAVAFKLSNGPLAILLPALWVFSGRAAMERIGNTVLAGAATLVAFLAAYGYWGFLLWQRFGNPVYPFYDGAFAPLRTLLGYGA
jgi:hypothetical protein